MPEISKKIHEAIVITDLKTKPDAVLACSDKLTTTFHFPEVNNIKMLKHPGLIGFPNPDPTKYLGPSLSIIWQQAFEMGENAALII